MSLMAAARKTTKAISLGCQPAMNSRRAMTGESAMRASVRMLGSVQTRSEVMLAQRLQYQFRDGLERVEDTLAGDGHGLEIRGPLHPLAVHLLDQQLPSVVGIRRVLLLGRIFHRPARIQGRLEVLDGRGVGEIPLV